MSWQCPYCETVNQDAVPVCTVCDKLAPVIEAFLSLESIQSLHDYNEKLDDVHHFESIGDYEGMLSSALYAISLYKENGLAVDKAKQAIAYIHNNNIVSNLTKALDTAIEVGNTYQISAILQLCEYLNITNDYFRETREYIKDEINDIESINKIMDDSYNAIIKLDITEAKRILDRALLNYPSEKQLISRYEDIKQLELAINEIKYHSGVQRKSFPRPKPIGSEEDTIPNKKTITQNSVKRKFPIVRRYDDKVNNH